MFHCTGICIMSVEHVLHKIHSFWNFYYIINFLRNKYYRGTSVPSHTYPCGAPGFTPLLNGVCVSQYLVFRVLLRFMPSDDIFDIFKPFSMIMWTEIPINSNNTFDLDIKDTTDIELGMFHTLTYIERLTTSAC